jgi:hypothetical protein
MTIVNVTEDIAGPAADAFAILGNFAGVQIGGPITAVEYEGEGVGMIRTISLGTGLSHAFHLLHHQRRLRTARQ